MVCQVSQKTILKMETANILMSQIEYDLNKATEIISPKWNEKDN